MKGGFSKLFGHVPRVAILEAFAQNSDYQLSAPEIQSITGVSRRSTYLIIEQLVKDGLLTEIVARPKLFTLNLNDTRGKTLSIVEPILELGDLEFFMKNELDLPQTSILPGGFLDYKEYNKLEKKDEYLVGKTTGTEIYEGPVALVSGVSDTHGTTIYSTPSAT